MIIIYINKTYLVRIMSNIQQFVLNNQRTLKKTLSYYILHISVAMLVAYSVMLMCRAGLTFAA